MGILQEKPTQVSEEELKELSILFLIINNLDVFRKNIELISVNCVYPEDSVKALLYSSKDINFSKIKFQKFGLVFEY